MIFVTVLSFLVCCLRIQAQPSPTYHCAAGPCSKLVPPDRGPISPNVPSAAVPSNGKWEVLDFKPGSGSVSCGVVKYEVTDLKPTVHLLCPAQEIYAPIRVHLTLTWKSIEEVPSVLRTMYVDLTQVVKFRSAPGQDPSAELTLEEAQKTHPQKQWIHFSKVNVALVLPAEK
jgi:hypothetical protein